MLVFHFMGDHAAGQYGASADLVRQIILIPAVSIASATIPLAVRAYATGGAGEARPHLEFSLEILLAAVLPAVAGVALTSSYIAGVILGSEFRETRWPRKSSISARKFKRHRKGASSAPKTSGRRMTWGRSNRYRRFAA
jgi:O-antigen/teichoic acid export membrane protein